MKGLRAHVSVMHPDKFEEIMGSPRKERYLNSSIRIHCPLCSRTFGGIRSLEIHVGRMHPDEFLNIFKRPTQRSKILNNKRLAELRRRERAERRSMKVGDPRLTPEKVVELARQSDLNFLRYVGMDISEASYLERARLRRMGFIKYSYHMNGEKRVSETVFTPKALELIREMEAET